MADVAAGSVYGRVAARSLAPLALMGLIFFLSAQPDLDSGLGVADLILRKIAHVAEYAALTALWAWALAPTAGDSLRTVLIASAVSVLYAASDEYHQSFVEGRAGSPVDVVIDAIGVAIAAGVLRYHRRARSAFQLGGHSR